jgi:alcohol/geraniol dehydrogenase (NADP+)
LLGTLAPKGRLHVVGAVLKPLEVPAFGLMTGQKSVSGSPTTGSPTALDQMLAFCARHSIVPITEMFRMSKVNEAFEQLRSGKARYWIVPVNEQG